jgi:hypothetical protein
MSPATYSPVAWREIERLRKDLEGLFERGNRLDEADELSGDMGRYLCVRVSGYLEQALVQCGRSVCENGAWGSAQQFALSFTRKPPNPRSDEIIRFVQRFSERWADELTTMLRDDERAQRINALLGLRNDIAHGKSQGVSRKRAYEYFVVVDEVVEFLLERFEPTP